MAQDSLRCLKMSPKMFHKAPRPPQDGSKKPPRPPRSLPKANILPKPKEINVCCIVAFSLPIAFRGLKMAPRWPKRAPREA
eukprot:3166036-Pyramimonas_sp.AAC.1